MTVETTIQRMFDEYPDLFSTRKDCYDHLFCTIGNGYKWERGQIVKYSDDKTEQQIIAEEEADYAIEHPKASQNEFNIMKRNAYLSYLPNYKFRWYPISCFSLINNVPDDVRPDWKAAVEECKKMLTDDGIRWQGCMEDISDAPAF